MSRLPWDQVEAMYGGQLHTLDEKRPFVILGSDGMRLVLKLSTTHTDYVAHAALERAWNSLDKGGELELSDLNALHKKEGSYIAAILVRLSGIGYTLEPLRLYRDDRRCPDCGSTMTVAMPTKGKFQGQAFLSCSRWPRCRGMRRMDGSIIKSRME